MSDEGERTCPLCAEEMDLTDQQLKPCRCGYEICVWCWHHIMDMAEKDNTDGRCPACRNPYNKEKIVGTAASCERLVSEMNMEKKGKSQKGKTKTSEGRKQLTSVRVIQKNLVYIVGLPLNLADEDLLQRKEYFSLYGKVQKVSISRTAAGTIQQFPNNTCSVYITYLKEEEAVRCIQAVNGYTLEGRLLRACFGTTKYCHAWIRNVPCNNPDCLYLHEVGSQEDSFSKDEIISGYSRSRPQQVPTITNTPQRRSGNMLPPPADDYVNNSYASSCKSVSKSTPNTSNSIKISPPNSSSGRSTALPAGASWGTRAFSSQQTPLPSSNGSQKPDTCSGPVSFSTALSSSNHVPTLPSEIGKKLVPAKENNMGNVKVEYRSIPEPAKQSLPGEHPSSLSENPSKLPHHSPTSMSSKLYSLPGWKDKNKHTILPTTDTNSDDTSSGSSSPSSVKDANDDIDEPVRKLSSDVSAMNIGNQQPIELGSLEQCIEPLTSQPLQPVESNCEIYNPSTSTGRVLETSAVQVPQIEEKDELLSFDNQRLKDPEVFSGGSYFSNISPLRGSNGQGDNTHLVNGPFAVRGDLQFADNKVDPVSQFSGTPFLSNGYSENHFNSSSLSNNAGQSDFSNRESPNHVVGIHNNRPVNDGRNPALDMGESSIISNILSLDYDPWNDSLNSPQNLAQYLGETDRNQGSQPSPWRAPQSNQSRFSFAREEEPYTRAPEVDTSTGFREQAYQQPYYGRDFTNNANFHGDNSGTRNGFPMLNNEEPDMYSSSHSLFSSSKLTGARSQIAAPPGFATPNRAPPGFLSHERVEQTFNSFSGHNMLDSSSFRNQYQSTQAGNNYSNGDIEFMDPAILAVGKGRLQDGFSNSGLDMRSNYSPQMNNFDNDARIQMLMQRSLSSHQNQRYTDVGDAFSSLADSIRNPSRVMEQSLSNNRPPFPQMNHLSQSRNPLMSNGHWDGWNEVQSGNNLGVTDLLRPERFSYNKYYSGYEDSKIHMPSQSDIYNRTYGI